MSPPPEPPETCANCGAEIPRKARSCPECGADERTGWRETSIYDGLDLPGEDSDSRPRRRTVLSANGIPWYWLAVAILLLFLLGFAALGLA